MPPRIKICGITNSADAQMAVDAGADALGFVFASDSPRRLELEAASAITRSLPSGVAKVGVFVDASVAFIRQAVLECGLDVVQLHGEERPEFCAGFVPLVVWKAFRVRDAEALRRLPAYATDAWLLDSFVAGHAGGTGATFNWALAAEAGKLGRPIVLAGGLGPHNVADAIRQVHPYAVDVSSGVEVAPGRKDPGKVHEFVRAVRAAA